jgi:chemotaxis protein MotB
VVVEMSGENVAPIIIIKRKKVVAGGGHHGGAWKVAYADFVTAMMAFFMLMWLLNATTEKQRKGLADYFSPTIPINRMSGGGNGLFSGDSVFTEQTLTQNGTGASREFPTSELRAKGAEIAGSSKGDEETKLLKDIESLLLGAGGESMVSENALRHVVTRVTDEGLTIELFDIEDSLLFKQGTAQPTPVMEELLAVLGRVLNLASNGVAVNGHTRSQPIVVAQNRVWDLSSARSEITRIKLKQGGLGEQRVKRVTGSADRNLLVENPMALRNNRIEVTLLRTPS